LLDGGLRSICVPCNQGGGVRFVHVPFLHASIRTGLRHLSFRQIFPFSPRSASRPKPLLCSVAFGDQRDLAVSGVIRLIDKPFVRRSVRAVADGAMPYIAIVHLCICTPETFAECKPI
jgi:hypothetical protein